VGAIAKRGDSLPLAAGLLDDLAGKFVKKSVNQLKTLCVYAGIAWRVRPIMRSAPAGFNDGLPGQRDL
jgi:hypothetical protein